MQPALQVFLALGLLGTNFIGPISFADTQPQENTSYRLSLSNTTEQSVHFSLSKNIFRQDPYQAEYQIQVPYEEQVPYQEPETYYDSEYQCHWETRFGTQCNFQQKHDSEKTTLAIQNETINERDGGHHGGGHGGGFGEGHNGGHHGGGDGGWRPHPGPPRGPICTTIPYTTQVCGFVTVSKIRYITKYRTETRYRTENRCCETRYREVYDHQYSFNVTVQLPEIALLNGEQELITFNLEGSETEPTISLNTSRAIYSYKVAKIQFTGANAYLDLTTIPKYTKENAGYSSLTGFNVNSTGKNSILTLEDSAVGAHLKTTYNVQIKDLTGGILASGSAKNLSSHTVTIPLDQNLKGRGPVVLEILTHREGDVVKDSSLNFSTYSGLVIK